VYSRNSPSGDTLTFGVSGRLWNGVLVMFDRETESFWTQLDGRAIRGQRIGEKLRHVDSTFTTWADWRAAHPATEVLWKPEDERGQASSAYADYFADDERLFLEELGEGLGGIAPKDLVFGVTVGDDALAVEASILERERAVSAVVGGKPVILARHDTTGAVVAFERVVDGHVALLQPLPNVDPTQLLGDTTTGKGQPTASLARVRVDRAFWYAWSRSHPGTRVLAE
jgi:hypothetical protein